MEASGNLSKMRTQLESEIEYTLRLGEEDIEMNDYLGSKISLTFNGVINCVSCGKVTKKAFGQGFCYPCFINSPMNAECIIRPELCEAHLGKGRDPEWEKKNHLQKHFVYLAVTSKVKVGVTRHDQIPTRWIDQGAWKAIIIAETENRQEAGLIEVRLKNHMGDRTPWRDMLKDVRNTEVDLLSLRDQAISLFPENLKKYALQNSEITELNFPVDEYPEKIKSLNFDKTPDISGTLMGIRAQYLIFEGGEVLNIRKFSGYHIDFSAID
ncbi:MAG: hypothetical protein ACJA2N_001669 [Salibacteraceae bacterium]|jgi:hypothetical protein